MGQRLVIEIALRPIGCVFHDVPRGMCHRCRPIFSHDTFFIGRLHSFFGTDMKRQHMYDGVWFQGEVAFKVGHRVVFFTVVHGATGNSGL